MSLMPRVLAALLALAAACAPVPERELGVLAGSFGEARTAGAILYGSLDAALAGLEAPAAGADCRAGAPAPACFDPGEWLGAEAAPRSPDIEARLLLLDLVAAYSETLIALASGASAEAVGARLDALGAVLGRVAVLAEGTPAAGRLGAIASAELLGALRGLAATVERARANAAARASILAERATVRAAIDALVADTPRVYDLFFLVQGELAMRVPGAPRSPASQAEFAKVAVFHASLGAYVRLLGTARGSLDALAAATEAGGTGTSGLAAAIEQAIAIRTAAAAFRAAVAGLSRPET